MQEIDVLSDSLDNDPPVANTESLQAVSKLVEEYDLLNRDLVILAQRTKMREERKKVIENDLLPKAMQNAGLESFTTSTGRFVKIEDQVRGNIPALSTIEKAKGEEKAALLSRREQAYGVIRKLWPGLLKTEVTVALGIGEAGLASRIAELIRNQFQLSASVEETVHPGTLNSHFKELRDTGKLGDVPVEPFALYIGPTAKIK